MDNQVSFDLLPTLVQRLDRKVDAIIKMIDEKINQEDQDYFMDLDKLVEYDPESRSKATFYGYVSRREIPYHKRGKKLLFLKSEVDSWLKEGRVKTNEELEVDSSDLLK